MVWVRLEDDITEHPKVAAINDHAFSMFVASIAYSNRNLTDGFVPNQVGLGQLRFSDGNTIPAIRQLEEMGLWEKVDGGWQIHDYGDYQPTREAVLAEREAAKARMDRVRANKKKGSGEVRANSTRSSDSPVPVPTSPPSGVVERVEGEQQQGTPPLLTKNLTRLAEQFPKPWSAITAERLLEIGETSGLTSGETAQVLADVWDWWAHTATPSQRQKKDAGRFFRNWIRRDTRSSNGQENEVQEAERQGRPEPVNDEALRAQVLALFVEREPNVSDPERFVDYVMKVRPYESPEGWVELAQREVQRKARAR